MNWQYMKKQEPWSELAVLNWQRKINESAVNGLAVILPELAVKKRQLN